MIIIKSQQPQVTIPHLDQLWFQVGGTRCNLACHHCFISCHPKNTNFGFLRFDEVCERILESIPLGVKEFYFTGGEPFLNPQMTEILEFTLLHGPATVLTNATVFKDEWLERLSRAEQDSLYSLEFRVSIDGYSAETNDPIRGKGTFSRAMKGVRKLVDHEFLPIITAVRTWELDHEDQIIEEFCQVLRLHGYHRPRLKILPTLKIGAEADRTSGYAASERVTAEMMKGFDESLLVCHSSRIVTDRGVHVCPILIETPDSLMGQALTDSLRPFELKHGACMTCYQYGSICSNASGHSATGSKRVESV